MIEKIESLRKKPRQVRNQYAFWIALLVTLVIVGVWSLTLPDRFSDIEGRTESPDVVENSNEIRERLGALFSNAKEALSALKDQASTTDTDTTGEPVREDIDFKALLASSSEQQALRNASTSTSTSTTSPTATSSISTTTPGL